MKRFVATLIFAPSVFGIQNMAYAQADWQVSQMDFGGVGLLQTPTARMADEGEFNVGLNYNDDYYHYTASVQLMPWLETTVRYTRVPDVLYNSDADYSGDNLYTDKGIDFKLRLLEESYWLPETSIGVRDFGGTGLFDGEFVAVSKRFASVDFSVGLGWGYLGQRGSVTNPFCKVSDSYCQRPSDFRGSGGSVDYARWFKGPSAVFGGIEYQTPYEPLRLKVEYEGNDYSQDFPVSRGGKTMVQHTPWNFGLSYRFSDWIDAKVSYQRGDTLTLGVNMYTNFNDLKATWRDEPKPISKGRPSERDTDWDMVVKELESNAGYSQGILTQNGQTIQLSAEQEKYRDRNEALERAAILLNNELTDEIQEFNIQETQSGLVMTEVSIDRSDFDKHANYRTMDGHVTDTFKKTQPTSLKHIQPKVNSKEKWSVGVEPKLSQTLGGPESFYLYSFGINGTSNVWLTDSLELSGSIYLNLFDNYDKFNYVENSPHINNYSTPRVRTMFRAYVHDNTLRLNRLQLTWFEQLSDNIYSQSYGGYLEMMFAGVGSEVLYRPLDTNWAVGADINVVSQRDPDSWFGVYEEDYFFYDESSCDEAIPSCQAFVLSQGVTGHVTGYYMPEWEFLDGTLFKVSAGQFLGGDIGARLDVSKQFNSGVIVGAYVTKTDLSAEEYGEGSYNKGFYISIPLDVLTVKPSTGRASVSWEPITRDGGQMLNKLHNLFETTDARSTWYQRSGN